MKSSTLTAAALVFVITALCESRAAVTNFLTCPDPEFIQPCSCIATVGGIRVTCSSINDENHVHLPFMYLGQYEIQQLTFINITFALRSHLFDNIKTEGIAFHDSTVQVLNSDGALNTPRNDLQQVEFLNSVIDFGKSSLVSRDVLGNLKFEDCVLRNARPTWFSDLTVNSLCLKNTTFDGDSDLTTFSSIKVLDEITYISSRLELIKRDFLPNDAETVWKIDFSDNKLQTLPDDIFARLERLKTVVLSGNNFQTIPEGAFLPIWHQLEELRVDRNPIKCDSRLRWILENKNPSLKIVGTCQKDRPIDLSKLIKEDLEDEPSETA